MLWISRKLFMYSAVSSLGNMLFPKGSQVPTVCSVTHLSLWFSAKIYRPRFRWHESNFPSKALFDILRIFILEIPYNIPTDDEMNVDRTSYFLVLNREWDTSSSFISSERGCVNPWNLTHFKPEMPPSLTNADTTMNNKLSLETLGDNGKICSVAPVRQRHRGTNVTLIPGEF